MSLELPPGVDIRVARAPRDGKIVRHMSGDDSTTLDVLFGNGEESVKLPVRLTAGVLGRDCRYSQEKDGTERLSITPGQIYVWQGDNLISCSPSYLSKPVQ